MSPSEVHQELCNWARWAHSSIVDLDIPPPPWASAWLPKNGWDAGWGDMEAAPATPPDPVDELAAIRTDHLLIRLPVRHWFHIRRHYYQRRLADRDRLEEACRAFCDLADAYARKRLTPAGDRGIYPPREGTP